MAQPNSPFPGAHTLLLNFVKKAAVVVVGWGGAGKIQNLDKPTHAYSTWVPGAQTELDPKVN